MLIAALLSCALEAQDHDRSFPLAVHAAAEDPALEARLAAAGKDLAKLLELAASYSAPGQEADAKRVFKRVLEVDAANETAHKALNHQFYDKKWFESFAELTKYKREESARMKAKGLARWKDEWVPEADVPFLGMGWIRDERGQWANPVEVARAKEVEELRAAGYQYRSDDDSWIAPNERQHWKDLEWKCGEDWLPLDKANEFHSKLPTCWKLGGEHIDVWSTCDWEGANSARWYADRIHPELVRIFGVEPPRKPHFVLLNSLAQYNEAAGAQPPLLPESEGISSLHGGYFADLVFDESVKPIQYAGTGVAFWDRKDDKLRLWGPYFLRWAAAQSWIDAIDPSWGFIGETVQSELSSGARPESATFWSEKKIPRWLRYGAASYVERFAKNPEAAEGASPWDLRAFAFAELKKSGGLRKLDEVFAFVPDVKKPESSPRLYQEVGLVVAFLLDGAPNDKKLAAAHESFKKALAAGARKPIADAVLALQKDLAARERDLRAFAGL